MRDERSAATAFVAAGANLGDRRASIEGALRALSRARGVELERVSRLRETDPVGGPPGQPRYLNGVARLSARLEPLALLRLLLRIERDFGRDRRREVPGGPRALDLDLLCLGDLRIATPGLVLPHPRMEERLFVLEPLAEIAPDLVLARSGRTVSERVAELLAERGQRVCS